MSALEATFARLTAIPELRVTRDETLSRHARFGIGGPADVFVQTQSDQAFAVALQVAAESGLPFVVIGGGSNLIIADAGYRGIVLQLAANRITHQGTVVTAQGGAVLQDLVDYCNRAGLRGLETMTGIPGWVGAAVYGNAGAYGRSISESVAKVRFLNGAGVREFSHAECQFHYRESIFKREKAWIISACYLQLTPADAAELQRISDGILKIRNEKYPPDMKCAGSIFKNFLYAELPLAVAAAVPRNVVREGKVPSAYFLEQVGAKGLRVGDIQVATYHANLIYNDGQGTAADVVRVIQELKGRVRERFGMEVEEEVQYVGW